MNHTKLFNTIYIYLFILIDYYYSQLKQITNKMFMLSRMLNHRLPCRITLSKRSVAVRSDLDLGNQMKLLNDQKRFNQALQLFDQYKKNNTETLSSMIITQALKACAQMNDLQRGSTIHYLISSRVKNDPYILASLIHLYG